LPVLILVVLAPLVAELVYGTIPVAQAVALLFVIWQEPMRAKLTF
jgi:hypothetical protein